MAGLVRRTPRRYIRLRRAAEMIGCSSESIRTGAVGKFKLVPLHSGKKTTPFLVAETEVLDFLERREREAAVH